MSSHLAAVDRAAIKTSFRLLVADVGGLGAAETVCRLHKTQLAECYDPHKPERMPPVDVVADLEQVGGHARVTAVLARLSRHALAPLPEAAGAPARRLAEVLRHSAEVGAAWCAAIDDARLAEGERRVIVDELIELQAAVMQAVAALLPKGE